MDWILFEKQKPPEREWGGTKILNTTISDDVIVTFESTINHKRIVKVVRFQNGKLKPSDEFILKDFIPIAWAELPPPYCK